MLSSYQLAKSIYNEYKDRCFCTSITENEWYIFNRNKWYVTYRLPYFMEHSVKGVIDECKIMFYDPEFKSKLDTNPNLIGFNNGIYDLSSGIFRDGKMEDYVSLSTRYYYESHLNQDNVNAVNEFMCQLFPEELTRNSVWLLLRSFIGGNTNSNKVLLDSLLGGNVDSRICIFWGNGTNGKSTFSKLIETAFGDYYTCQPLQYLDATSHDYHRYHHDIVLKAISGKRLVEFWHYGDNDNSRGINLIKSLVVDSEKIQVKPLYEIRYKLPLRIVAFSDGQPQFSVANAQEDSPLGESSQDETVSEHDIKRLPKVIELSAKYVVNPNPNNPNEYKKRESLIYDKIKDWAPTFMSMILKVALPGHHQDFLKEVVDTANHFRYRCPDIDSKNKSFITGGYGYYESLAHFTTSCTTQQ